MHNQKQEQYTFIIRLWREKSHGNFVWRGSLTHLQTGEKKYFQAGNDLGNLIAQLFEDFSKEKGVILVANYNKPI